MSVTTRTDDDVGRGSGHGAVLPLGLSPDDVQCPICVETISDPFVTSCGHTFCYQCVTTQLKHKNSCPSCGGYLTADNIYPNFLLNKILQKAATAPPLGRCSLLDQVQRLLADSMARDPPAAGPLLHHNVHLIGSGHLVSAQGQGGGGGGGSGSSGAHNNPSKGTFTAGTAAPKGGHGHGSGGGGGGRSRLRLRDIDAVLEVLYEAREELERRESSDALHLLLCFLKNAREHKARQMAELRQQLAFLEHDILTVTSASATTSPTGADAVATADEVSAGGDGGGDNDGGGADAAPLEVLENVVAAAAEPPLAGHGALGPGSNSSPRAANPQQAADGSSGGWLRRAFRHLDSDDTAAATSAAAAVDYSGPPAETPNGQVHQEGSGAGLQDLGQQQQQRQQQQLGRRAPPLRRASWCLHTITPAGGISSVTVDTSSLHEPGQQAEAFGAAVQHALAAATGAGSGGAAAAVASTSVGGPDDEGSGGGPRIARQLHQAAECEADMNSAGQPPLPYLPPPLAPGPGGMLALGAADGEESGNAPVATAAAASAASDPQSMEVEASARAAAGPLGLAAAAACRTRQHDVSGPCDSNAVVSRWCGMPRCGSADNFMLLAGQAATAVVKVTAETAVDSRPSAFGDATAASGGGGAGGGEDGSALSGAARSPPSQGASGPDIQRQGQLAELPALAAQATAGAASTLATAAAATAQLRTSSVGSAERNGRVGTGADMHCGRAQRDARRGAEMESEDEMDIRERRRGRGRLPPGPRSPPPPPLPHGSFGLPQTFPNSAGLPGIALGGLDPRVAGAIATAVATTTTALNQGGDVLGHVAEMEVRGGVTAVEDGEEEDLAVVQASKRRRMLSQFDVLEQCYLQLRTAKNLSVAASGSHGPAAQRQLLGYMSMPSFAGDVEVRMNPPSLEHRRHVARGEEPGGYSTSTAAAAPPLRGGLMTSACGGAHPDRGPSGPGGRCNCEDPDLETFGAVLAAATQYSRLEVVAEIPRHGSGAGASGGNYTLLSSIEFDNSDNLFATAGVVPRILVYDYQALLSGKRPPLPVLELTARSKLSCLSYSCGTRQHLLAADYLGGVALWDTETGMQVQDYEAHERRVWGVDFCPAPSSHDCFASGSDDGLVKVWSTRQAQSCLALELRGNVCSVEWHPVQPHLLAVGSAFHCAVVYDIRQPAAPLHTLLGHRRAVSYVRWLPNRHELVTASTDSTLKLWSLTPAPLPPTPSIPGTELFKIRTFADPPVTTTITNNTAMDWPGSSSAATAAAAAAAFPSASSSSFRGAELIRTFSGHMNERNFVGLATGGDYLACGSENHEVFVYHRSLPQPALRYSFAGRMHELEQRGGNGGDGGSGRGVVASGQHAPAAPAAAPSYPHINRPAHNGHPQQHQHHQHHQQHYNINNQHQHQHQQNPPHRHHFVTAVQWRRNSPHLLVANSAGCVWLMGLRL